MTMISHTTSTPEVRPVRLEALHRIRSTVSGPLSRVRAALATAVTRGQLGPIHDVEVGRRTGARI